MFMSMIIGNNMVISDSYQNNTKPTMLDWVNSPCSFNKGKQQEVKMCYKHSKLTNFSSKEEDNEL